MDEGQVEADLRFDVVWQRRTWRFGSKRDARSKIQDAFGFCNGDQESEPPPAPRAETAAMSVLDLQPPVTIAIVKARYKELVKRHHPDANGGDKAAEERFKLISEAYKTVMDSLTTA